MISCFQNQSIEQVAVVHHFCLLVELACESIQSTQHELHSLALLCFLVKSTVGLVLADNLEGIDSTITLYAGLEVTLLGSSNSAAQCRLVASNLGYESAAGEVDMIKGDKLNTFYLLHISNALGILDLLLQQSSLLVLLYFSGKIKLHQHIIQGQVTFLVYT